MPITAIIDYADMLMPMASPYAYFAAPSFACCFRYLCRFAASLLLRLSPLLRQHSFTRHSMLMPAPAAAADIR